MTLAALQPTPVNLTDALGERCAGWTGGIADKPSQLLVIGYVTGSLEAAVSHCDQGAALGFCTRLRTGKVATNRLGPAELAAATERLCRQHRAWTIRQVGIRILVDTGVVDAR